MLVQNGRADDHQHHATDDFRTLADDRAEHSAEHHAKGHHGHGRQTDRCRRDPDIHVDKRQADADRDGRDDGQAGEYACPTGAHYLPLPSQECLHVREILADLGVILRDAQAEQRRFAHRIPFLVKLNHNETLSYPTEYDQTLYASVEQAFNMGAVAVGATIYFGSEQSRRQIEEISAAFERAHELGMVTVLWAYLRNNAFKVDGVDYHDAADLTAQANHLGVTIEADIIKQKLPECNGGYNAVNFGKTHKKVYTDLSSDHPIDLTRYQLANCYMGRAGLINRQRGESPLPPQYQR